MSDQYAIVLRACDAANMNGVGELLGRAFSLKDATCANILQSAPIILIDGLSLNEAAALSLCLRTLEVSGATLDYIIQDSEDLPKIDWPKKPSIFKQSIEAIIRAYALPVIAGNTQYTVLSLLAQNLSGEAANDYEPISTNAPQQQQRAAISSKIAGAREFTGANLPEVTPFSNMALSDPASSPTPTPSTTMNSEDLGSRMNELFGMDDDDELVPSSNDVTNILDKILPDDEPGTAHIHSAAPRVGLGVAINGSESSGINQILPSGSGNFSLFLSKIPDSARRDKAVPIIAELANIAKEEAESLSKKVIIPVLRSVSQDEAEAARHRFAEIGVLARIKNS